MRESERGRDEVRSIERRIVRTLGRLVESECGRLGITPLPLFVELNASPRTRYIPMQRLLLREGQFLLRNGASPKAARTLRKAHLACYRIFLSELRSDVRQSRRDFSAAMAAAGKWDFRLFLSRLALSESSLVYLSWLGWKATLGLTVDTSAVRELLDSLLAAEISPLEASSLS